MSFARDVYTATEEQTDFTITFPYISSTHVRVFQNGVEQTQGASAEWTIVSESTARFNTAADVSEGDVIVIDRATSQDTRLVDWETGTTLTEDDLDNDSLQAFYMAQEAIDKAATALGLDAADLWDATGKRITEVGTPTVATDAATKGYADGLVIAEGNVPPAEGVGTLLTSDGTNFSWVALEATGAQIEDAAVDTEHLAADAVTVAKIADAELKALAGLTSAANKVPRFTGSGTADIIDFLDEDDMASDSATAVSSQQAAKAYVDGALGAPSFSVHRNGVNQTPIAVNTFTKVQFTTEAFDTGGYFDSSTNYRFTPLVAGKYLLSAGAMLQSLGDTGKCAASIYKNGSEHKRLGDVNQSGAGGSSVQVAGSALVEANGSTDYFEVFVLHSSGGTIPVDGSAAYTYFQGFRVGA